MCLQTIDWCRFSVPVFVTCVFDKGEDTEDAPPLGPVDALLDIPAEIPFASVVSAALRQLGFEAAEVAEATGGWH